MSVQIENTAAETDEWVTDHRLHGFNQYQSKPGPADANGQRWMERELTGLVNYVCNCGYSTGWVPRDSVPLPSEAHEQHAPVFP